MQTCSLRRVWCVLAMALAAALGCGGGGGGGGGSGGDGQATVGAAGGTVALSGGPRVVVPPGALAADTVLSIRKVAGVAKPAGALGEIWEFLPEGTLFAAPVTVTLPVPEGTTEAAATGYWSTAGGWAPVASTFSGATATLAVTHFSRGFVGAACVEGGACPGADTCHAGVLSCSTGTPSCGPGGAVEDGTSCGGGSVCSAGACGPPPAGTRTVRGTYRTVWWHDDGAKETTATTLSATALFGALTWSGSAWVDHPGSVDASTGALEIPGVPFGRYLLYVDQRASGGAFFAAEHFATTLDLTRQRAGRAAAAPVASPPPITWAVSGLVPWSGLDPYGPGDLLEVASGHTWEPIAGLWYAGELETGATSASIAHAWGVIGRSPYPDSSKGDALELHQLASAVVPAGEPGAGTRYRRLAAAAALSGVAFGDGTAATVTATLAPPPGSASVSGVFGAAQASALVPTLGTGTLDNGFYLTVLGHPHRTVFPAPLAPRATLLELTTTSGAPSFSRTLSYGLPLHAMWRPVVCAGAEALAPWRATGSTVETWLGEIAESCWPAGEAPATLAPALGGAAAPTLDGTPLTAARSGISTTPTLAWSAPAVGTAARYTVVAYKLTVGGTGRTSGRQVLSVALVAPPDGVASFEFPPGVLVPGGEYAFEIVAEGGAGTAADAPSAEGYPNHVARRLLPNVTCAPALR